ncbi:MAG: PH domain-containing protein [Candidatus Parcubacteria bacterium]|nr:PH domain-containing protein [Candidatus Parcubacteria bacterium]
MLIEKQIPNRQKDENLVLFLRRHPIIIFSRWAVYLFLGLIPPFFYYFISINYPDVLTHPLGYPVLLLLACSLYLFIALFFLNAFIDYYLDVWIVTDRRIINIEQRGLFNREIAEHTLERVQDVSALQKGIFQTFFSYGDVHVQTAGEIQRFIFRQIDNPFEVVRVLNNLIHKHEAEFDNRLFETIKDNKTEAE